MTSQVANSFWDLYKALPEIVRQTARRAYAIWQIDHYHPGLHFKRIENTDFDVRSVRVGKSYRALGYVEKVEGEEDTITWFWIGTHAEYDKIIENL